MTQILKFWLQWKKKDPVLFYHGLFIQEAPPQSPLFTYSYSKAKLWRFRGNLTCMVKPSAPSDSLIMKTYFVQTKTKCMQYTQCNSNDTIYVRKSSRDAN